jgi:large subunit ribosomal protein L10
MRSAGGEYRIYKNTLVRRAADELQLDLGDVLVGPTALAFVTAREDGTPGDVAAVAKAVQDFAKGNPLLVVKGGLLGEQVLDADGVKALASLPTAAEIYARLAGAIQAGARGVAGAVSGVSRSIAYVLQAAIDAGAFAGDAPAPEAPAEDAVAEDAAAEETAAPEATAPEASESAAAEAPAVEESAEAPGADDSDDTPDTTDAGDVPGDEPGEAGETPGEAGTEGE